ncbi:MAG: nicotinate-nucleotide--dimethylbenzimidazole phosphoribosyltransferase, partial [Dehalococcoidia bacterium]|nr:nicotinate-nucleotide--dimethylbenzimidazole phosphoribosyltransferase [Dehalococcoidia bacterium]
NITVGTAMTHEQAWSALRAGSEALDHVVDAGAEIVATGDMGIANTTPASALAAAILGLPVARVTGRGTGLDDAGLAGKVAVIERALATNRDRLLDPLSILAALGGLEIAALVGTILRGAARRVPVVLDGFISAAAAMVADALCPSARPYLVAAHRSVEPGHGFILDHLGLRPLLDLDLRLGEGTGAMLGLHLVDAAQAILLGMATFEEAGVDDRPRGA